MGRCTSIKLCVHAVLWSSDDRLRIVWADFKSDPFEEQQEQPFDPRYEFRNRASDNNGEIRGHIVEDDLHADYLDLSCSSYEDFAWDAVNEDLWSFARSGEGTYDASMTDHLDWEIGNRLLMFLRKRPRTKCYLAIYCIALVSLLRAPADRRTWAVGASEIVSTLWDRQIPLTFYDTMVSGWPVFQLLHYLSLSFKQDIQDGFIPELFTQAIVDILEQETNDKEDEFAQRMLTMTPTQALHELHRDASYGKRALCYFNLAVHLMAQGRTVVGAQLMLLGERELPQNVPIYLWLIELWPFWNLLGFIEKVSKPVPALKKPFVDIPRISKISHTTVRRIPASASVVQHLKRSQNAACTDPRKVHVVTTGDWLHFEGLLATLKSAVLNSRVPSRLCLHVFLTRFEIRVFREAARCAFPSMDSRDEEGVWWWKNGAGLRVWAIDPAKVAPVMGNSAEFLCEFSTGGHEELCDLLNKKKRRRGMNTDTDADTKMSRTQFKTMGETMKETGNLHSPHNFVRFVLHSEFPFLDRLVYLDSDVIVKSDISMLYDLLDDSYAVAAAPRRDIPLGTYFNRVHKWFPLFSWPSFNAGVMVLNLSLIRGMKPSLFEAMRELQKENNDGRMWRHGSQPPMLYLFYDKVQWIDDNWNISGLGSRIRTDVDKAHILHWSGPRKPWRRNGENKHLWEPYRSDEKCWHWAAEDDEIIEITSTST